MKGTVQDPFKWTGANVDLTLSGPNLSEIYPLLGIPGPPTPPYTITGKLDREPGIWKFGQSKWRVGESDLTGEVTVDERKKPQFLTAKLVSQKLVFEDLAPLVGATPARKTNVSPKQAQTQAQLEATGDLFPNVPLHVEKMRAMNMDVTLDAKRVIAPPWLPVQALAFRVADPGRQCDGQAAHPLGDGRRHDRGRARHRCAHRRSQGEGQPQGDRHRAEELLPRIALLRRHAGQDPGTGRTRGQWPLARPCHGLGQRVHGLRAGRRLGQQPDGEPGRPADIRCAGALCDRRQPHSDQVRRGPPQLPAGQCRVRPDRCSTRRSRSCV